MRMTIGEIQEAAGAKLLRGRAAHSIDGVSTDTRTLKRGNLFVALKGDAYDGHDFAEQAISGGAAAVLVEASKARACSGGEAAVLSVDDTLRALGDIAAAYRSRFGMPFVAITGSNGKTTTKEMIAHILVSQGTVTWARKSFNNSVGVPLTLFEVVPDSCAVVIEMGTSGRGEIARLCEMVRPQIGVITNVGPTHLQGLGTIEGVAAAKGELVEALGKDGTAVLNADDEWTAGLRKAAKCRVVSFGTSAEADIFARDVEETGDGLRFVTNEHVRVELPLLGRHNVMNALAAIAVCRRLGMKMEEITRSLRGFTGVPMRMEVVRLARATVINDAYNANPASMAAALDEFSRYAVSGRRHFVCGDMLELGASSARLHRELGARIAAGNIDRLWLLGKEVRETRSGAIACGFDAKAIHLTGDYGKLEGMLLKDLGQGDAVLLKGSRAMRVERVVEALRAGEGWRKG
jgi:UDP-N-acetylmuramoyl-tripeptide--D-alanyl-D-alanine ligase